MTDFLTDPPRRPSYRTPSGQFRRETEDEMKNRYGMARWAELQRHGAVMRAISRSSPYVDLLKAGTFRK